MNDLCEAANGNLPTVGKMAVPNRDWDVGQLGECAEFHAKKCAGLKGQLALHRYLQGKALTLAKEKVPRRMWGKFLKQHAISTSSDARARELFRKAGVPDELNGKTVMEAYVKYGIEKRRRQEAAPSTNPHQSQEAGQTALSRENQVRDEVLNKKTGLYEFLTTVRGRLDEFEVGVMASRDEEVFSLIDQIIEKLSQVKNTISVEEAMSCP